MVTEVVEEVYDVVISPDVIMPGGERQAAGESPGPLEGDPLPPSKQLWQGPLLPTVYRGG